MSHHRALDDVSQDIHQIFIDAQKLTDDSLAFINDVEHLERNCKDHWKELLFEFLCSLCGSKLRNVE